MGEPLVANSLAGLSVAQLRKHMEGVGIGTKFNVSFVHTHGKSAVPPNQATCLSAGLVVGLLEDGTLICVYDVFPGVPYVFPPNHVDTRVYSLHVEKVCCAVCLQPNLQPVPRHDCSTVAAKLELAVARIYTLQEERDQLLKVCFPYMKIALPGTEAGDGTEGCSRGLFACVWEIVFDQVHSFTLLKLQGQ